jgi:hypothetical protein
LLLINELLAHVDIGLQVKNRLKNDAKSGFDPSNARFQSPQGSINVTTDRLANSGVNQLLINCALALVLMRRVRSACHINTSGQSSYPNRLD